MMSSREKIDIGVVGGGIGGLALALGLINNGFKVTVYEAAHRFGEIGSGVMFSPNAVRAMKLIDPRLEEHVREAGGRNDPSSHHPNTLEFRHGYSSSKGPGDFELIGSAVDHTDSLIPASRAMFLEGLIGLVPEDIGNFNKRLVSIAEGEDGFFALNFADGTVARHSVVLGADGIHSQMRKHVLGPDSPNLEPVWTQQAGWRGRIPMEKAIEILGRDMAMRNTLLAGDGAHVVSYCVGGGKFVNLTSMTYRETWEHDEWVVPSSKEEVREVYKGWPRPVLDLLDQIDSSTIRGLYHFPETETFYRGRTAIIGDAAHATTPFQGAGAGMAIEDACVLSAILASVTGLDDVEAALAAYDAVRRPRSLKLVRTSVELADVINYRHPDTGSDLAKIGANVSERFKWIWNEDLSAEIEEGRKIMPDRLRSP